MIPRHLTDELLRTAGEYPVFSLTGPRQSGKTTLVRHVFDDYEYVSLELPDVRERARSDPRGFLDQYSDNVIFDCSVVSTPEFTTKTCGPGPGTGTIFRPTLNGMSGS